MAGGAEGAVIIGGAWRGWGTILRGSGALESGCRCCCGWSCPSPNRGRSGRCARGWLGLRRCRRFCRHASVARLFLFFLLLGQNGLHHIAGLGDVRKIDFGNDGLLGVACGRGAAMLSRPRFLRKMRANLFRLVQLQRAGVGLARRHAQLRKNVENRTRLYFQLFREIVDTNLAHPPLFSLCCRTAVSCFITTPWHWPLSKSLASFVGRTQRILCAVLAFLFFLFRFQFGFFRCIGRRNLLNRQFRRGHALVFASSSAIASPAGCSLSSSSSACAASCSQLLPVLQPRFPAPLRRCCSRSWQFPLPPRLRLPRAPVQPFPPPLPAALRCHAGRPSSPSSNWPK